MGRVIKARVAIEKATGSVLYVVNQHACGMHTVTFGGPMQAVSGQRFSGANATLRATSFADGMVGGMDYRRFKRSF